MPKVVSRKVLVYCLIIITILALTLLAYLLFKQSEENSSYKYRTLKYVRQFDNTQNYYFVSQSEKECGILGGCLVEVFLKGEKRRQP